MDSEEPQQPAVGISAGQQLKQAREKLGLDIKDVADAQHLRVFIIQAIEDGQYDQIDSELFLKGYVRAYAKQVRADADALIHTLDLELEPLRRERALQEQENPLVDIERRRRKKRQMAKALLIIAVLGAIAFAVWKYVLEPQATGQPPMEQEQSEPQANPETEQSPQPDTEAEVEPGPEMDNSSEPEISPELAASPDPEISPETSPEAEISSGLAASPEPGVSPELASSSETMDSPENAPSAGSGQGPEDAVIAEDLGDAAQPNNDVAVIEPGVQADPVFEESAQPASVASPTRLEMSFVSNCWVQVTDSSGARLVASLQRDGDQISVSGRAPFKVVIGAVDAVQSVRFDGEPVDLSNFRVVNNRTEFTLTL